MVLPCPWPSFSEKTRQTRVLNYRKKVFVSLDDNPAATTAFQQEYSHTRPLTASPLTTHARIVSQGSTERLATTAKSNPASPQALHKTDKRILRTLTGIGSAVTALFRPPCKLPCCKQSPAARLTSTFVLLPPAAYLDAPGCCTFDNCRGFAGSSHGCDRSLPTRGCRRCFKKKLKTRGSWRTTQFEGVGPA